MNLFSHIGFLGERVEEEGRGKGRREGRGGEEGREGRGRKGEGRAKGNFPRTEQKAA